MTEEALAYLNEAIGYIQENSVRRAQIDWSALCDDVYALVADAQTKAQTYPAIERALELLGDHHSFFRSPEEQQLLTSGKIKRAGLWITVPEGIIGMIDPGSPAAHAEVQVGERIEMVNGQSFSTLTREQRRTTFSGHQIDLMLMKAGQVTPRPLRLQAASYEIRWVPQGRRLEHNIGYLNLPGLWVMSYRKAYAQTIQQSIREIDQSATCGWVIDLRCNVGGSMWPMWAGVGPILGEGEIISFMAPGVTFKAVYRNGRATMEPGEVIDEVEDLYELKRSGPPVAVLTSPLTGSAGEFVAMAFRGRPHMCSFGEPTAGVPTANDSKVLSDEAMIALTTYIGADRSGQTYEGPLIPDHPVEIDWTELGTDDDPVLRQVVQWLHAEEGCH